MLIWVSMGTLVMELDMSSSAHIDNKKKDILVPGKGQHKDQNIL